MIKNIITVTDDAVERIRYLLNKRGKSSLGIRVGIKTAGCTGHKYVIDYVDEAKPYDEIININDLKIFIEPKAVMYLINSEMDYQQDQLKASFVFNNPNEKGRCGCGESFRV